MVQGPDETIDWIEGAADSLSESERYTDDHGDKAQLAALQAIAKALIGMAGVMVRQEQSPRKGNVW